MDRKYKLILMKKNMFPVVSVCSFRGAIRWQVPGYRTFEALGNQSVRSMHTPRGCGWRIFLRAEAFSGVILQPECPRVGRLRAGWKIWRKNKAFRHVDTVMEKNNRSNFKKLLFFQWKRLVLFFKDLVLFRKEQDVWEVSNVHAGRLVTCHPIRY